MLDNITSAITWHKPLTEVSVTIVHNTILNLNLLSPSITFHPTSHVVMHHMSCHNRLQSPCDNASSAWSGKRQSGALSNPTGATPTCYSSLLTSFTHVISDFWVLHSNRLAYGSEALDCEIDCLPNSDQSSLSLVCDFSPLLMVDKGCDLETTATEQLTSSFSWQVADLSWIVILKPQLLTYLGWATLHLPFWYITKLAMQKNKLHLCE